MQRARVFYADLQLFGFLDGQQVLVDQLEPFFPFELIQPQGQKVVFALQKFHSSQTVLFLYDLRPLFGQQFNVGSKEGVSGEDGGKGVTDGKVFLVFRLLGHYLLTVQRMNNPLKLSKTKVNFEPYY